MKTPLDSPGYRRTLDAKPNEISIVKPAELVDVVEMSPLTLNDRRIFNLLLANAWDRIGQAGGYTIPKRELQTTEHKGTDRLVDSIRRLMAAIVEVRVLNEGKWQTRRVQLLGENSMPDGDDDVVHYDFPPSLCEIITESTVFARLHRQIMFALSSKYALALYEMVQKRGNLNKTSEEFTVEQLRAYLGVPPGKLTSWINMKNKAITPAVREVSDLSDFTVTVEPVKGKTRKFTHVKLTWQRKDIDNLKRVARELDASKVGRKARLSGTVEAVAEVFGTAPILRPETLQKAKTLLPREDVYQVEGDWRDQLTEMPADPDGAFLAYCTKRKASR